MHLRLSSYVFSCFGNRKYILGKFLPIFAEIFPHYKIENALNFNLPLCITRKFKNEAQKFVSRRRKRSDCGVINEILSADRRSFRTNSCGTHCEWPQRYARRYEYIQVRDNLKKSRSRSLNYNLDDDVVSNALLKSNCSYRRVASFLPIPMRISFVSLSRADCVLRCFLKPTWKGSRIIKWLKWYYEE